MPDETFSTTDDELAKFLIAMKVSIARTSKNNKNRTIFYFDKALAQPYLDQWGSGAPIMVDLRDIFQAHKIFNMRVHDEI